jgi:hypothetical protein
MSPLLECAPMLHSRDVDETRAFLAKKVIRMDPLGSAASAASIDVRLNGVYLRDAWLGYVAYGTPTQVQFSASSSAWLGREEGQAKSAASACGPSFRRVGHKASPVRRRAGASRIPDVSPSSIAGASAKHLPPRWRGAAPAPEGGKTGALSANRRGCPLRASFSRPPSRDANSSCRLALCFPTSNSRQATEAS